MNTKRLSLLVIVLFLLAALPGMTAVAQDAAPVGQTADGPDLCAPLPAMAQPSASDALPEPNLNESRYGNDTRSDADRMSVGDVMRGSIWLFELCADEDVDFFKFNLAAGAPILIDLDYTRPPSGNNMFTQICLQDAAGNSLACDDDRDGSDLLLYYALPTGNYFIKLNALDGASREYIVTLSKPVLVSAAAPGLASGGDVGGIHFYSDDILAWSDLYGTEETWDMLFDASDVGITRSVTNIAAHGKDELLLSLGANQTLPGVGAVTPFDIFIFDPTTYGQSTAGTFRVGMKGSEQQLTTTGEKLDAIEGFTMGIESDPLFRGCFGYPVSTVSIATVNRPFGEMKQDDDDIFCKVYNPIYGGFQRWDWFFDVRGRFNAPPSEPAAGRVPGLPGEDVIGMAYDDAREVMYLSILGSGSIAGHAVTQKDIFAINYPSYAWGGLVWHGPDHGWNYNLDAIEYPGG